MSSLSSSSLVLPIPKWNRKVETVETPLQTLGSNKDTVACQVCEERESRYTCPKCGMPYCSITCYREHNREENGCTEAFYRDKVSEVLRLEQKERYEETQTMLNRQYMAEQEQQQPTVPEEDLYNLLVQLEQNDNNPQELPSSVQKAFQRAIEQGELNHLILQHWSPWWRPELVTSSTDPDNDYLSPRLQNEETLDERMLKIPRFTSFRIKNPANLVYNLVDLLYGIVWTLRLFHGPKNARNVPDSVETLIMASAVLSEDARYSDLEEVMTQCTTRSTRCMSESTCNSHWHILAQDVAVLVASRRYAAHILLDAIDILRHAIHERKKTKQDCTQWRRIRKKVELYLSWAMEHSELFTVLADEIEAWIEHWKGVNGDEPRDVKLPSGPAGEDQHGPVPVQVNTPLLVATKTIRRKKDATLEEK